VNTEIKKSIIATLGPSWNFSLAESLASLSLEDGPQNGYIIAINRRLAVHTSNGF
jgi:hypothetical protein